MKPNRIATNLENFPVALAPLCQIAHWVLWRWELRKGKNGDETWTKPPYMAANPRRKAKNNDPATWSTYQVAAAAVKDADGVGFALLDTPFAAVDLDHCIDIESGAIDPWAKAWVDAANGAYVEATPSGEGLRIIGLGSGDKLHRKWKIEGARANAAIEVYRGCERYITITGAQLGECKELAPLDLLEKIQAHYDGTGKSTGDKRFDFNSAGAGTGNKSVNWDDVIRAGAPAGADASAMFHAVIGHLCAKGMSIEAIIETLSPWPNGIARRYAGRLRREVERSFEKWQSKRKIHIDDDGAGASAAEPDELLCWDEVDKNGKPKPTYINTKRAINALNITCQYDAFHDRFCVEGKVIKKGRSNLDHIVREVRDKIPKAFGFDPGLTYVFDAVTQLGLNNEFDPVLDYLNALEWDGTPRLERWPITYLGAADTELNREFGRLTLIAAIRRVRRPGTKFDSIVVLEGPMGTQKSMAIEILAGSENFSDQTILGVRDREAQELLAGIWLFEIAELSNIRRTEVEHIKAFASRTADRARPAYGRTRIDQPRRCILFATTNNDRYLKEADRRFWPIKTGTIDIDALRRDRDQLWAEAAAQERGASIVLRRELWDTARAEQEAREDSDPWDDKLVDTIGTVEQGEERVASVDLLEIALGIHISRQRDIDFKRLGRCMRRLGWNGPKKTEIDGKPVKGYTRPVQPVPTGSQS
jgi:hypothetical protein